MRRRALSLQFAILQMSSPLETSFHEWQKRSLDLLLGSLFFLCSLPVGLLIALAIRLDSPGPILFLRKDNGDLVKRVGKNGCLFVFPKFRSMRARTDSLRFSEKFSQQNFRAGPLTKFPNDPRITRVGKFLRKFSLDELPQLWCVLKGEMSLVGPRPHLPEEVAQYSPKAKEVLQIKPGITGLPAVSGRSELDFQREIELDLSYLKNWSLLLDLKIIWKTIFVVLFPKHRE